MKPNILIAVPFAAEFTNIYTEGFFEAVPLALMKAGISYKATKHAGTQLPQSRNFFASLAMESPEFTHLLQIDSDMATAPEAIVRLVQADKDFIGMACPKR